MQNENLLRIGADINKQIEKYSQDGQKWAFKDAEARFWEQNLKSIRSQEEVGFMEQGKSATASEKYALSSEAYQDALKEFKKCKGEANELYISLKAIEMTITAQMSLNKVAVAGGRLYS